MKFDIEYSNQAKKFLAKCEKDVTVRILRAIESLGEGPSSRGVKKIKGSENLFRLRVGDYRVLYELDRSEKLLGIVKIDKRPRAYRGL